MREVARILAETLTEKPGKAAQVIALHGELGAGKTTFSKAFVRGLGSRARVLSPTFVLMKRHELKTKHYNNVYHLDCYRVEGVEEIRILNWTEIITNPKNIVLVEWPTRITRMLPKKRTIVRLTHDTEKTRNCTIEFHA